MKPDRDLLAARLVSATLTHQEYLRLRNTVRVVRGAGVNLDPENERQVKKFEATVAEYERLKTQSAPTQQSSPPDEREITKGKED